MHRKAVPISANLDASTLPARGTVNITKTPQQMQLGFATKETTIQTNDDGGTENVTTDAVVDYDASGAMKDLNADLTADVNGTSTRFNASVGTFPSSAKVEYHRDPREVGEVETACGLPLAKKVPGRIDVTSQVTDPIENLDVTVMPDEAGQGPLSPGDSTNYIGYQHDDTAWSVRALFDTVHDVSLYADPTAQDTPILSATGELEGIHGLAFEYIDPAREDEGDNQTRDRIVRGTLEGNTWPIHAECHGDRLQAWPGTEDLVDDTRGIERVHVTGANWTLMNQTASALSADVTGLQGGVSIDLGVLDSNNQAIDNKSGFAVQPVGDARVQDLVFDVDWDPSDIEPPAECTEGSGSTSPTAETVVEWGLPVGHANVSMTTQRPFDHPDTPNWVKRVKTCEQDTLALELWGLEDVRFEQTPRTDSCKPLTQVWINMTKRRNTDLRTTSFSCDNGNREGKRVKIRPLPTTFMIKTPIPPWYVPADKGALYRSSQSIDLFEYIDTVHGCSLLHTEDVDPASNAEQILGVTDAYGEGAACTVQGMGQDAASATGRFVQQGFDSVKQTVVKAAHSGQRGVECTVNDVASDLGLEWDTDGYSEQRDQPRFHEVTGTMESLTCSARSKDDSQGSLLRLPNFPGGRIDVNLQSQWRPSSGQAPIDTLIPGTLDIPESSLTDPQCLEWNYTADPNECETWETTRQVHERIAEDWLDDAGRIFEDQDEYAVPWREWADPLT